MVTKSFFVLLSRTYPYPLQRGIADARLLILAVLFFISSCTTTRNFAIEIREPAKITFPADVSNVVVINNAASPENGDSVIWVSASALTRGIFDEEFFSETMMYLEPVRRDTAYLEIRQIPNDIKQAIYTTTGADAIISIDRFLLKYTQKVNKSVNQMSASYSFVNAKTEVNITYSVYLRGKEKPLTSFVLQDSLFFSSEIIGDSTFLYDILPNALIEETAIYIGEKAVPYFVPTWEKVERKLYTSLEAKMKEAFAYAKANKWTTAKEIWLQLYDRKSNPKTQARLANNIAVAFEMQDDLHKALEWAQKADNAPYISSLTEGIKNHSLLKLQLGN